MSDTPEPLPVSTGQHGAGPAGTEGGAAQAGQAAQAARAREPGRPAPRAEAIARTSARRRIGIRELRQHASVYVDLAEKGYTVDITNRGRLVAQLVPVREPGSPLERLIAAGIMEPAEEPGGVGGLHPYPAPAARAPGSGAAGSGAAGSGAAGSGAAGSGQAPGSGRAQGRGRREGRR